jgi:hypothetical protein
MSKTDFVKRKVVLFPPSPAPNTIPDGCSWCSKDDIGILEQFKFLYIYVWCSDGNSFWLYPIAILKDLIYGYVHENLKWKYTKLEINKIDRIF